MNKQCKVEVQLLEESARTSHLARNEEDLHRRMRYERNDFRDNVMSIACRGLDLRIIEVSPALGTYLRRRPLIGRRAKTFTVAGAKPAHNSHWHFANCEN